MSTWTHVRSGTGLLVAAALSTIPLLAGCGGDATAESGEGPARAAVEPGVTSGPGTGTLVLGDDSYELRVTQCDLEGDYDSAYGDGTLFGSGRTDDGLVFNVMVGREDAGASYTRHEVVAVSLAATDQFDWTARRESTAQGWRGEGLDGPAPDEPLVRIDGKTVRAAGVFFDTRPGGAERFHPVQGRVEATCP